MKATKEIIRETSDKIWNKSAYLTHNELDTILTSLYHQVLSVLVDKMVSELEELGKEIKK